MLLDIVIWSPPSYAGWSFVLIFISRESVVLNHTTVPLRNSHLRKKGGNFHFLAKVLFLTGLGYYGLNEQCWCLRSVGVVIVFLFGNVVYSGRKLVLRQKGNDCKTESLMRQFRKAFTRLS